MPIPDVMLTSLIGTYSLSIPVRKSNIYAGPNSVCGRPMASASGGTSLLAHSISGSAVPWLAIVDLDDGVFCAVEYEGAVADVKVHYGAQFTPH